MLALIWQIYEYREPSKRIRLAMAAPDPRQALGEGETWVHSWFRGQQIVEATSELLLGHTKLDYLPRRTISRRAVTRFTISANG